MTREQEPRSTQNLAGAITERALREWGGVESGINPKYVLEYYKLVDSMLNETTDPLVNGRNILRVSMEAPIDSTMTTEQRADTDTQKFVRCYVDSILGSFDEEDFIAAASSFTNRRDMAVELAVEKGIPVENIYKDDDLYNEVMRRSIQPEDYINQNFRLTEKVVERFPDLMADALIREQEKEDEDEYDPNRPFAKAAKAFTSSLFPRPSREEHRENMIALMKDYRRDMAVGAYKMIERVWGSEAFFALPNEVQAWFANDNN